MTTDATRANAQTMPISRRTALAVTAAGITAALAGTVDAAPASPIHDLIEAHREAERVFEAAVDVLAEYEARKEDRRELFVPLSIGGAQSAHAGMWLREAQESLREDIGRRYREAINGATRALEKVSPEQSRAAVAALRKAHAHDLRAMRRAIDDEWQRRQANGFAQAYEAYDASNDAERSALLAILGCACASLSEQAIKADYLTAYYERAGIQPEWEHMEALLSSMSSTAGA
jgi:hypothetical protein